MIDKRQTNDKRTTGNRQMIDREQMGCAAILDNETGAGARAGFNTSTSFDELLQPTRQRRGMLVGPDECRGFSRKRRLGI
jgi:hypothetical protein